MMALGEPTTSGVDDGMTGSRGGRRPRASRGDGEQLHTEIVTATKVLLAECGSSDAVSIRAVADAVGVTAPAIYLHFADKDALIAAVVVDVFSELDAAMLAAAPDAADPLARLCGYGQGFVAFAIEHPEHYRIAMMERRDRVGVETTQDVDRQLADSAFLIIRKAVAECTAAGIFAPVDDDLPLTLELWSVLHGIAALMVAKPYVEWGDRASFVDRTLRTAALGHAVTGLLGDDVGLAEALAWLRSKPC